MSEKKQQLHVHGKTKNKSFLELTERLSIELQTKQRNHLGIYNTSLVKLDPYNHTLTDVEKHAIKKEALSNPWYFLREIVRVSEFSTIGSPLELNIATLAMLMCVNAGVSSHTVSPRQTHRTITTLAYALWYILNGRSVDLYGINYDGCILLGTKLQTIYDRLPSYIATGNNVTFDYKLNKITVGFSTFHKLSYNEKAKVTPAELTVMNDTEFIPNAHKLLKSKKLRGKTIIMSNSTVNNEKKLDFKKTIKALTTSRHWHANYFRLLKSESGIKRYFSDKKEIVYIKYTIDDIFKDEEKRNAYVSQHRFLLDGFPNMYDREILLIRK